MSIQDKTPVRQEDVFNEICDLLHVPKDHRHHVQSMNIHIPTKGAIEYTMTHLAFKPKE